jgi:hypothetical protein
LSGLVETGIAGLGTLEFSAYPIPPPKYDTARTACLMLDHAHVKTAAAVFGDAKKVARFRVPVPEIVGQVGQSIFVPGASFVNFVVIVNEPELVTDPVGVVDIDENGRVVFLGVEFGK